MSAEVGFEEQATPVNVVAPFSEQPTLVSPVMSCSCQDQEYLLHTVLVILSCDCMFAASGLSF